MHSVRLYSARRTHRTRAVVCSNERLGAKKANQLGKKRGGTLWFSLCREHPWPLWRFVTYFRALLSKSVFLWYVSIQVVLQIKVVYGACEKRLFIKHFLPEPRQLAAFQFSPLLENAPGLVAIFERCNGTLLSFERGLYHHIANDRARLDDECHAFLAPQPATMQHYSEPRY